MMRQTRKYIYQRIVQLRLELDRLNKNVALSLDEKRAWTERDNERISQSVSNPTKSTP